jgi:class 3 adenylate cyclase/CHASE2 domain-containing sensor protein
MDSPDRSDLIRAYRWEMALRAISRSNPGVPQALAGVIPHGFDITPPVDLFAAAAKGVGFVSFEREKGSGVVREIPLLANARGALVSQLGLLVAADVLELERESWSADRDQLMLEAGAGAGRRFLPLSRDGLTPLNWHVPRPSTRWEDSFTHIPVSRVLEIALNAEAIRENERRLGLAMAELVELRHAQTAATYTDYVRLVNRRLTLRSQAAVNTVVNDGDELDGELADVNTAISRIENDALVWLRRAYALWANEEPSDEDERAERNRIYSLYAKLGEGQLAAQLDEINRNLASRTDSLLTELRPQIEDKICLVGYTASGVADLVTSPVYSSMPGVMAHANVINMVLQSRPVTRAPNWVNIAVLLLGGAVITAVTSCRGAGLSLVSLLVLLVVVLAAGGVAFRTAEYHIASLTTAISMCAAWACVTAYRQSTEQRIRRQFQQALSQYTSPAVAARIAQRASAADLAPQPAQVTCFFSDLYGFTPLSERLGAQRTRQVLNPYLHMMSRLLVEHHAIINKFMGDGIFAFFNAPIWPCGDHAEASCACADASIAALEALNRQTVPLSDGETLAMRIGLSTGEVFVGDYGSDTKLDYTCIGDIVNLGARLEETNKALGTVVLVDRATRNAADNRFVFRSLGLIEVPGKTLAVEVHELVGRDGRIGTSKREYAERFEEAVRHYQACQWGSCLQSLDHCRDLRPDDRAADCYRKAATRYRHSPPPGDWSKTVPLAID